MCTNILYIFIDIFFSYNRSIHMSIYTYTTCHLPSILRRPEEAERLFRQLQAPPDTKLIRGSVPTWLGIDTPLRTETHNSLSISHENPGNHSGGFPMAMLVYRSVSSEMAILIGYWWASQNRRCCRGEDRDWWSLWLVPGEVCNGLSWVKSSKCQKIRGPNFGPRIF